MDGIGSIILAVVLIVVTILIIRWLGAWMLRIDEIIDLQKETLKELRKLTPKE